MGITRSPTKRRPHTHAYPLPINNNKARKCTRPVSSTRIKISRTQSAVPVQVLCRSGLAFSILIGRLCSKIPRHALRHRRTLNHKLLRTRETFAHFTSVFIKAFTSLRCPCRKRNADSKGVLSTRLETEESAPCVRIAEGWPPCCRKRSTLPVRSVDGSSWSLLRGEHSPPEPQQVDPPMASSSARRLSRQLGPPRDNACLVEKHSLLKSYSFALPCTLPLYIYNETHRLVFRWIPSMLHSVIEILRFPLQRLNFDLFPSNVLSRTASSAFGDKQLTATGLFGLTLLPPAKPALSATSIIYLTCWHKAGLF